MWSLLPYPLVDLARTITELSRDSAMLATWHSPSPALLESNALRREQAEVGQELSNRVVLEDDLGARRAPALESKVDGAGAASPPYSITHLLIDPARSRPLE